MIMLAFPAPGIRNPVLPDIIGNPTVAKGGTAVGLLIGNITGGIMIIAFLLAFFYLLTGAISWITSGGDKGQLEAARNKITHAIIGVIIIASVWAIMNILAPFLGITFPDLPIPTISNSSVPAAVTTIGTGPR
jgi:hypothetical protein